MELELDQEKAALLERILTGYLSDLRMEIGGTDDHDFRENLKREEVTVKALIASLTALVD